MKEKLKYFGITIISLFLLLVISAKTNSSLTRWFMGSDQALIGIGDAILIIFVVIPLAVLWTILFLYQRYCKKYKIFKDYESRWFCVLIIILLSYLTVIWLSFGVSIVVFFWVLTIILLIYLFNSSTHNQTHSRGV